jgi:hypothetical protein
MWDLYIDGSARPNDFVPLWLLSTLSDSPKMRSSILSCLGWLSLSAATILQNGQVRETDYPDTKIQLSEQSWKTYGANASEIHWSGRWDAKHISHWS